MSEIKHPVNQALLFVSNNAEEGDIYVACGLSDEREEELKIKSIKILQDNLKDPDSAITEVFEKISLICENANELMYISYKIGGIIVDLSHKKVVEGRKTK